MRGNELRYRGKEEKVSTLSSEERYAEEKNRPLRG